MEPTDPVLEIPALWRDLPIESWRSPLVLVGGSDSGKTSFARYAYGRLLAQHERVGYIDLDPGQNTFCLPATAGLGLGTRDETAGFPPQAQQHHVFVGSNSPVGHEARVLAALHRLHRRALEAGAGAVIVDTSGFVDAAHGAAELKWAEVELLRPCTVVALQREEELVPIIAPLHRLAGVEVVTLPVSHHVRSRSREARRAYRARCYRAALAGARRIPLELAEVVVFVRGPWMRHQLAALEDAGGFTLALALMDAVGESVIWVRSLWSGTGTVAALRLGALRLDPDTFEDTPHA